jgi:hypothetical protein
MVPLNKFTKASHFIPINLTHNEANILDIYLKEVAKLHGIQKTIVSDNDSKFTVIFWKGLFKGFGIDLNFIPTYHPESDGKIERVEKVIEDMLRIYFMEKP